MNQTFSGTRQAMATLLAVAASLGCHTTGASQVSAGVEGVQPAADHFDLLIYGFDFDPGEHEVLLRTNLDFGSEWVSLGTLPGQAASRSGNEAWSTAVFTGLSTLRFLGQDFREQYIDLKIVTAGTSDGSRVSAVYAMPASEGLEQDIGRITTLIETDPLLVEEHSLASHVQPAPAHLQPASEYVEHVRAPMKHTRPGVMEVEQLQVEWRNRGG